jgi:hypothetical protein
MMGGTLGRGQKSLLLWSRNHVGVDSQSFDRDVAYGTLPDPYHLAATNATPVRNFKPLRLKPIGAPSRSRRACRRFRF